MPCSVSREEEEAYHRLYVENCEKAGRWDLLATKQELAGWLCDALRGDAATPEAQRWWKAHIEFNDRPLRP